MTADDADEALVRDRVQAYSILDTGREAMFDRFVFTAAQLFRVPIATLTVIDGERHWIKARVGLEVDHVMRADSLCNTITGPDHFIVVEDASHDLRLHENPLVTGPPHVRFFAGVALVTADGVRVGSLCIADRVPKTIAARQVQSLVRLGQSVIQALEARRPD